MAEHTAIEWADHTFNPWWGCTNVSAACDNCYAEAWSERWSKGSWGPHAPRVRTSARNWNQPLKWNAQAEAKGIRARVFCASMADVFDNHGSITSGWHGDLWHLIDRTPHLDWLLLTKRPQNIAKMLPETYGAPAWGDGWPNVWLGTTVENQAEADRRIPPLLNIPARIRFLSMEPLLGPVDLTNLDHTGDCRRERKHGINALWKTTLRPRIDWIIAGGESGPNARPSHPDWFRSLRDQCASADVPFFFKQWGEWVSVSEVEGKGPHHKFPDHATVRRVGKKRAGRTLDGVVHDGFPQMASTDA